MVVLATPDLAATSSMDIAANPPSASSAPAAIRIARSASWLRGLPRRGAPTAESAAACVRSETGIARPLIKRAYQIIATSRSVSIAGRDARHALGELTSNLARCSLLIDTLRSVFTEEAVPVRDVRTTTLSRPGPTAAVRHQGPRLALILVAAFMVVLDFSIVNVALP